MGPGELLPLFRHLFAFLRVEGSAEVLHWFYILNTAWRLYSVTWCLGLAFSLEAERTQSCLGITAVLVPYMQSITDYRGYRIYPTLFERLRYPVTLGVLGAQRSFQTTWYGMVR